MTIEKTARLADLDPVTVGREAARRVCERVTRLAFRLSPGVTAALSATNDAALAATDLALTVTALTEYAQRGLPVWDWEDDAMVADAMHDACGDLVGGVIESTDEGGDAALRAVLLDGDETSNDPLRLVLTAAWARVTLARGDDVTPAQLGALAGLHPSRVRALRAAGEIRGWTSEGTGRAATPCPSKAARVWLAARSVSGV